MQQRPHTTSTTKTSTMQTVSIVKLLNEASPSSLLCLLAERFLGWTEVRRDQGMDRVSGLPPEALPGQRQPVPDPTSNARDFALLQQELVLRYAPGGKIKFARAPMFGEDSVMARLLDNSGNCVRSLPGHQLETALCGLALLCSCEAPLTRTGSLSVRPGL